MLGSPGQLTGSDKQGMERVMRRTASFVLATALDAHHRGDLALLVNAADIGSGAGEFEGARVAQDDLLHEINLLQRQLNLFEAR